MSKKLISVMLALVMVLSVFSISAFAVNVEFEDPDAEEAYTQMWYLETTNEPDASGNYTVDVYLEANYYVGAISFHIDAVGATLTNVAASDFITANEDYNASVQANKTKGNVYIIPEPTDATVYGLEVAEATHIATLTYTLTAASATITLNNDAKTIDNDGKLIAARLGDGILSSETMYYGQWVVNDEYTDVELGDPISEVTLGSEQAADPVLSGVDGGYVDTDRGYVYGVPAGANANDYFSVENGRFEIDGTYTGATLVVYDATGNEFATYTLVIFGDVNCDGTIDTQDSLNIAKHANFVAEFTDEYVIFAADVNADGAVDTQDSLNTAKHANFVAELAANVWA